MQTTFFSRSHSCDNWRSDCVEIKAPR